MLIFLFIQFSVVMRSNIREKFGDHYLGTLNHNVMSYCKHGRPSYEAELWIICLMLF